MCHLSKKEFNGGNERTDFAFNTIFSTTFVYKTTDF